MTDDEFDTILNRLVDATNSVGQLQNTIDWLLKTNRMDKTNHEYYDNYLHEISALMFEALDEHIASDYSRTERFER